jgi:hypothetical protein
MVGAGFFVFERGFALSTDLEILWGVPAIAAAIGRTARATYHMLESGHLPGAKKVGGRWCVSRRSLVALFEMVAA